MVVAVVVVVFTSLLGDNEGIVSWLRMWKSVYVAILEEK